MQIQDLFGVPVFAQSAVVWSRRELDRLVATAKVPIDIVSEPLPEVCIALAEEGMGVAVIADDNIRPGVKTVPVHDDANQPIMDFVKAYWRADGYTPRLQELIAFIKSHQGGTL